MDIGKLKHIHSLLEEELQVYLKCKIEKLGYSLSIGLSDESTIAYIYGKKQNGLPALLIAHTDTVYKEPGKAIYHDRDKGVIWSPDGLGADDRAGVYAILEMIRHVECDVLFTAGEEEGAMGARVFMSDFAENPGYHMLVQMDKDGEDQAAFYDNEAEDFQEYIMNYGFGYKTGTYCDIKVLGPGWKVNAVNLSVGYYNNHTRYEYLNLDQLESSVTRVLNVLSNPIPKFDYRDTLDKVNQWRQELGMDKIEEVELIGNEK